MGLFEMLFGKKNNEVKEILDQGAVIIDVRSVQEFKMGKVQGSINIPLEQLSNKMGKIKKYKKPIVLCCASGSRSASAVGILHNAGIVNVYNGRSWNKVDRLLNQQ
ncbi:MAG: rhodanese-like domain-containing protein [Bacteroidales bacterium]|jgi:phage shock protein E|nr:rhodanese-like domain-containing protein [Bacteroidales bacterium]